MSIPIIGRTRSWQQVRFVCQPVGKPPTILAPGAQPEITGWMIGFEGLRSDDMPVRSLAVIPLTAFTNVQETFKFIGMATQAFESFRTCACLPSKPCPQHTQENQRPS